MPVLATSVWTAPPVLIYLNWMLTTVHAWQALRGSTVRQVSTKRNLTATQISIWCKLFTSLFQNIEIVAWWQTADMFVSCSTCIITFYVYLSDIDACPDYQCQNNATYVDLPEAGAYNCTCAAGYTGLLCETGRHCFWYTVFCKHRNQWSRFYFSWNVS